jgi:hypothetical protein
MNRFAFPLYIITHPRTGFSELRENKRISVTASLVILLLWIFAEVIRFHYLAFPFNYSNPARFNLLLILSRTFLFTLVWSISNWAFTVFLDGKAKLSDIWCVSLYALLPYILAVYVQVFLSQFLLIEEQLVLDWIGWLAGLWALFLFISGIMEFQEYSFFKAVTSIFLGVVGIAIIVFILFLSFTLFNQIGFTFRTVFNEIMLRI